MYSTTRGTECSGCSTWRRRCSSSLVFTAYPLIQMVWMSFHNWSMIEPPKWVGVANFVKA